MQFNTQQRTSGQEKIFGDPNQYLEWNKDPSMHIALNAYYKAEARGFEPGHELEDWLQAEIEIHENMNRLLKTK